MDHLVPPDRRSRHGGVSAILSRFVALTFWGAVALVFLFAGAAIWLGHVADGLPEAGRVEHQLRRPSIVLLDREGREIARRGPLTAPDVDVATLPEYLIGAVLAVEDRRFYDHHGVDLRGLSRAAWANVRAGRVVQGGSTLTQQLAKNLFLNNERTLRRKSREMLLALAIERRYSKEQILESYLNRVYFGAGAWGVEAAAQRYFGTSAADVSLGEAALLAGLLKAPSRYSPVNDVARAEARATVVLDVMTSQGVITEAERAAALAEPVHVREGAVAQRGGYFIDWALAEARDVVGEDTRDLVVRSTLDLDQQAAAERAVTEGLADAEDRGAEEAALIALDGDGAVRAMVGGRAYTESQFNRATQARRQPGSAFKPFVYAAAMEAGLSPWDVRRDEPITIGDWTPTNYREEHVGDVTLISALAESINTVAVSVAEEVGRERVVRLAKRLGVRSRIRATRSMALGSHEVAPIELTGAYAAFANGGFAIEPYAIVSIETMDGERVWSREAPAAVRGLDLRTARLMNVMLARVITEGTGRSAALPDRPAAGKTGTTNDFRDAWFIGYVPGFVAGVWIGADDSAPMARVTGGGPPARIWRAFMVEALEGEPVTPLDTDPDPPSDMISAQIAAVDANDGRGEEERRELDRLVSRVGDD